jgi:hypothetical protein
MSRVLAVVIVIAVLSFPSDLLAGPIRDSAERWAAEAGAVQVQQAPYTKKEPAVGLLLSLVWPGLGQFYNGPTERTKAWVMTGAGVGTVVMMAAGMGSEITCINSSCEDNSNAGLFWLGFLGHIGTKVYSMYDAATSAGRLNREHGLTFNVQPEPAGRPVGVRTSIGWTASF